MRVLLSPQRPRVNFFQEGVELFEGNQFGHETGESAVRLRATTLCQQFLSLRYKSIDNVFAGDLAHRHAVFKDHSDAASEGDAELRVMRFAGPVDGAAHDGKVQRLFNVSESPLDLSHDLNKVIDVE